MKNTQEQALQRLKEIRRLSTDFLIRDRENCYSLKDDTTFFYFGQVLEGKADVKGKYVIGSLRYNPNDIGTPFSINIDIVRGENNPVQAIYHATSTFGCSSIESRLFPDVRDIDTASKKTKIVPTPELRDILQRLIGIQSELNGYKRGISYLHKSVRGEKQNDKL